MLIVSSAACQTGAVLDGDYIASIRCCVGCVAVDCKGSSSRWDGDLFSVRASQDEDALSSGGCGAQGVDSTLDLGDLAWKAQIDVISLRKNIVPPIQQ